MPSIIPAISLVKGFEGFRAAPYLDSAGVPTIGFGSTHYPDGHAVTMRDAPITETEALAFLGHGLWNTAATLWQYVKTQPTTNQWSALCSIAYNVGVHTIANSTLLRCFNQCLPTEAAAHFVDWDKAAVDGRLVIIQGLLNRRLAEQRLFLTPDTEA
jgi:lysozyme